MSQPSTTSQKPKPPLGSGSTTPRNLVACRYLPRNTPSMSLTATLTHCAPDLRMAATAGCSLGTGLARVLMLSPSVLFCVVLLNPLRPAPSHARLQAPAHAVAVWRRLARARWMPHPTAAHPNRS